MLPVDEVTVLWARMPGTLGLTDGTGTVWLDPRQRHDEARCTLAHELVHVAWGHTGCQGPREEARVVEAAARLLLPDLHPVADALRWAGGHVGEAAEELTVDEPTLRARLTTLRCEEVRVLRRLVDGG